MPKQLREAGLLSRLDKFAEYTMHCCASFVHLPNTEAHIIIYQQQTEKPPCHMLRND